MSKRSKSSQEIGDYEVTTKDALIWCGMLIGLVLLGIWATLDYLSKVSL